MPSKSIKGIGISSDNIKKTWEEIFLTGQETTAEKQINQAVSKSLEKLKKSWVMPTTERIRNSWVAHFSSIFQQ